MMPKTRRRIEYLESRINWLEKQRDEDRDRYWTLVHRVERILKHFGLAEECEPAKCRIVPIVKDVKEPES